MPRLFFFECDLPDDNYGTVPLPIAHQSLIVQVITCTFWMMILKVGFSFRNFFWVLGEKDRIE